MSKKKQQKVKRRISKKKIFIFVIIVLVVLFILKLFNTNITNIYISGNYYLADQTIIEEAGLSDYPNSIKNFSFLIEKKLKDYNYIYSADVKKNFLLNEVYIEIEENYPLFYYKTKEKTILFDQTEVDDSFSSLVVINSIPEKIYDEFLDKIKKLNRDILDRISEIEYSPNNILEERFFLLMNDGNYVYITLDKLLTLNKYLDIIKRFDNKKGILYLDSGEYFDVFDQ